MSARRGKVEHLMHKDKKDSNIKWFIFAIVPILNLYFLWKLAESVSGHEKVARRGDSLDHQMPKDSTAKWFLAFFLAFFLTIFGSISLIPAIMGGAFFGPGGMFLGAGASAAIYVLGLVIDLYLIWKVSELIAGHEETYDRYSALSHPDRKGSTAKWFAIYFLGLLLSFVIIGLILVLYFVWKQAWVVSGHEVGYSARDEERGRRSEGAASGRREAAAGRCPECGAEVPDRADFCPRCGADVSGTGGGVECPECGAEVDEDAEFCPQCGAELEEAEGDTCPECGDEIPEGSDFCPSCGAELEEGSGVCPECGAEVGEEDDFCSDCGAELE